MDRKHSVFGLTASEIRRLLDECIAETDSSPQTTDVDAMAQLLREHLDDRVSVTVVNKSPESWILDQVQRQVVERSSKPVLEILSDAASALPVVEKVKDRYKLIAQNAPAKAERHVATAIYYAAIAHALVFHAQKITQHPDSYVMQSLSELIRKPWMAPELSTLFLRAKESVTHGQNAHGEGHG